MNADFEVLGVMLSREGNQWIGNYKDKMNSQRALN